MPATLPALLLPSAQVERLISVGVHELAGLSATDLRGVAAAVGSAPALLVIHPDRVPPSRLAPLIECGGKRAFVVVDMTDVDDFSPTESATLPADAIYTVEQLDRGDHLANWSPDEALSAIITAGRTSLTLGEGLHWLLQQPEVLARNHCFMTIGSRLRKSDGSLDARTPALWISNGSGRDGRPNRNAPKVGWCWAGNRHTWLGVASAGTRHPTTNLINKPHQ